MRIFLSGNYTNPLNLPLTRFINTRINNFMHWISNIIFWILEWYILGFVKWFQSTRGRAERTPRRDWNGRATYGDQFQCPKTGQELNYTSFIPFLYFLIYLYPTIVVYFNIIGYILWGILASLDLIQEMVFAKKHKRKLKSDCQCTNISCWGRCPACPSSRGYATVPVVCSKQWCL